MCVSVCADLVAITGDSGTDASQLAGEFHAAPALAPHASPSDSGTESGEEFRLLSPEVLAEVQSALTRLEAALPGLDPARREALIRLVTRLQTCLKLQPPPSDPPPTPPQPPPPPVRRFANRRQRSQRHTVGVSKEELADARRWLQETRQQSQASSGVTPEPPSLESYSTTNLSEPPEEKPLGFRPVKFNPNQANPSDHELPLKVTTETSNAPEPVDTREKQVVLTAALSYSLPQDLPKVDSGCSLLEYDPSLALFTPAQSVQIAVHKAAINKQISQEESKRENNKREESYDSDDGDVSSVEDDQTMATSHKGLDDAISSAQRLLQIASDNNKKTYNQGRFQDRNSKKQKFKRANTIDIPKPANFYESFSQDERDDIDQNTYQNKVKTEKKTLQPSFQPKTESDMKFLAFLKQANKSETKASAYNPSARGGQPWTNRFVNLKTAFESDTPEIKHIPKKKIATPPVVQMWQNNTTKSSDPPLSQIVHNRTPQPLQNKLPWTSHQGEEEGVVIGSLTVKPSPSAINKFSHAPKSAFKPIEKKPISQSQPQKLVVQPQAIQAKNHNLLNKGRSLGESSLKVTTPQHLQIASMSSPVNGSVKQLATQKFSGENISNKPIIKQYPVIQDKQFNSTNAVKHHTFLEQSSKPTDLVPTNQFYPPPNLAKSVTSAQRHNTSVSDSDFLKAVKVPQQIVSTPIKDNGKFSPPKQFINSPPLNNQHSSFAYPTEPMFNNSFPSVINKNNHLENQSPIAETNSVPYYSQEPAFVQHTTFSQPLYDYNQPSDYSPEDSFLPPSLCQKTPTTEFVEEYSSKNTYPQYNGSFICPEDNQYLLKSSNQYSNGHTSPPQIHIQSNHTLLSDPQAIKLSSAQHRFSDDSLVPNPLDLSQVYRPVHLEYLPYEPPLVLPPYETPDMNPIKKSTLPDMYKQNDESCLFQSTSPSKLNDDSHSIKQFLNIPYESGLAMSPVLSNASKSPYFESASSSTAPSPCHWNQQDLEENEISVSEGTEIQTAVAKVMGHAQCQTATTVSNRTKHRYEDDYNAKSESQSLLRTLLKSPHSPTNIGRKLSSERAPNITELLQSPKSPVASNEHNKKLLPEIIHSYPVVAKPPVIVTPQSNRGKNERNPVMPAVSAFRPLVNNLSKAPDSDFYRPPPIPSSPPSYGRRSESDTRLIHSSNKSSSSNSLSSKLYDSDLSIPYTRVSPSKSPSFPNVLQKSESWHQLVKEQMTQGRHPPPQSPRLCKTKSSHTLVFPKQFEAHLAPELLAKKQTTVDQYLKSTSIQSMKTTKQSSKHKKSVSVVKLDDNLENVDEAFESLFQEVAKRK